MNARQSSLATRFVQTAAQTLGFWKRAMTLGVRAAVFDSQGRVLLVRHTYLPGWYFPGGGVDAGETLEAALRRELREEASVEVGAVELFGVYLNSIGTGRDHVALYVAREDVRSATKRADFEIAEANFFPLDALPPDTTPATRDKLAELSGARPRAAYW